MVFRYICQILVNSECARSILDSNMSPNLFKRMILLAERIEESSIQGLATQAVGFIVQHAKNFETREDLINSFKKRMSSNTDAGGTISHEGITWTMHECINVRAVKAQIRR